MLFGKRVMKGGGSSGVQGTRPSARPKSPRDALTEKIDQLMPGQTLAFRLAQIYGPEIMVVEANKDYPTKGHRFGVLSTEPADGKPGRVIGRIWESDKAKPVAAWLLMRGCQEIS